MAFVPFFSFFVFSLFIVGKKITVNYIIEIIYQHNKNKKKKKHKTCTRKIVSFASREKKKHRIFNVFMFLESNLKMLNFKRDWNVLIFTNTMEYNWNYKTFLSTIVNSKSFNIIIIFCEALQSNTINYKTTTIEKCFVHNFSCGRDGKIYKIVNSSVFLLTLRH